MAETELRAPIDGFVQQLAIHTLGGLVTPAQQLLVLVPEGRTLLLEATVANADVGFIHPGQEVEVKIETFNFTRYGLMHGRVIEVSPDAVTADRRSTDGTETGTSSSDTANPPNKSPSYIARIALNGTSMKIDGKTEPLKPGMAVTAESRQDRAGLFSTCSRPCDNMPRTRSLSVKRHRARLAELCLAIPTVSSTSYCPGHTGPIKYPRQKTKRGVP